MEGFFPLLLCQGSAESPPKASSLHTQPLPRPAAGLSPRVGFAGSAGPRPTAAALQSPWKNSALRSGKQFVLEIAIATMLVKTHKLENTTAAKAKGTRRCWQGCSSKRSETFHPAPHTDTHFFCCLLSCSDLLPGGEQTHRQGQPRSQGQGTRAPSVLENLELAATRRKYSSDVRSGPCKKQKNLPKCLKHNQSKILRPCTSTAFAPW